MAIIATGMTLIIVSRNIDLSVGSIVGVVGMTLALMMTQVLPERDRVRPSADLGHRARRRHGARRAHRRASRARSSPTSASPPSSSRSAACWPGGVSRSAITQGVTIAPVDPIFRLLGGGPRGSLGGPASWVVGIVICIAVRRAARLQPAAAPPVRLRAPTDMGGGDPRGGRLRLRPGPRLHRQQLPVARRRSPVSGRSRRACPSRRAASSPASRGRSSFCCW